jgi:hypothetical protein
MSAATMFCRAPVVRDNRSPGAVQRPALAVALAALVLCLAALLRIVAGEHAVVALTTTLHQGQRITAADLRATSAGGGDALPAADIPDLVGQYAITELPAGTVLTRADLSSLRIPVPDQVQVAVRMKAGQVRGLVPGALVMLRVGRQVGAIVADTVDARGGMITVDLLVPSRYVSEVARRASGGGIVLTVAPVPRPSR